MSDNIKVFEDFGKYRKVNCKNGETIYSINWIETTKESLVLEQKINGKWYFLGINDSSHYIALRLAQDLIAKKINKCTYIKSITRSNLYTGYQRIYVTYDNNTRATYTIIN